ncbi:MAG: tetratricopeptide repeat protein [bacterium]
MKYDPDMSRKELLHQPDELVDLLARISELINRNKTLIGSVVGVLTVVIAAVGIYISLSRTHLREAGELEEKTIFILGGRVGNGGYPSKEAKYKDALSHYSRIRKEYSGTPAARRALLGEGNTCYALGDYQRAIAAYKQYLEENTGDSFAALVKNSLAFAYEESGNYDQAIKLFESLSVGVSDKAAADQLINVARCYEKKGAIAQAVEFYRKAGNLLAGASQGSFSGSPELSRINRKLNLLKKPGKSKTNN